MQVTQTLKEGLKREYKISLNPNELSNIIGNRLTELCKTVKMDGFRPGKVPFEVIKKKYYNSIKNEEMPKFLDEKINKYLNDNNIRPLMQPEIENLEFVEDKKLEFELKIELMPEVVEPDYSSIKLQNLICDISDKDIEENLNIIALNNKNYVTKEGKAELRDKVVIDFVGSVDGKEFEGGKAENFDLVLGTKTFIDTFEEQLVGASAGDEIDVNVTFPSNYRQTNLAGKPALFVVKVKEVKSEIDSEVDEDLASRIGFKSLENLKEKIKEELELNYKEISLANLKKNLFDKLEVLYNFDVPESLVKQEFDHLWGRVTHNQDHNHVHDENCNHSHDELDNNETQLKEDYRKISVRRVKLGLVLAEIAKLQNIQISNEDLKEAVINEARKYPSEQQHAVLDFYRNNPKALEMLKSPVIEDKVVNLMLDSIEIEDKKISSKELLEIAKSLK